MNSKHETSGDSSTTAATTTSPRNIASQPVALSVWKPKTLFSNFGPSGPAQDLVYFRLCAASCLEDTLFSHMSAILKISALISDREFTSYDDPAFFQGLVDSLLKLLAEGKFADDLDNFCVAIQNDGDYDEDHLTVMKFAFIVRDMCEALESSNPASVHALSGQIAEGLEHIDHWAASAGTAAVQSSGKPKKKAKKKEKQEKKAAKEKTANSSKKDKSVKKRSSQKLKAPDPRKSEKSDKRDSDSHDSWDA